MPQSYRSLQDAMEAARRAAATETIEARRRIEAMADEASNEKQAADGSGPMSDPGTPCPQLG